MANPAALKLDPSLHHTDTVTKALLTSSQAFADSRSALNSLLSLRDCQQQPLSHSVSEAQATVQAREDEKKKQQAKKDKSKFSSTPTPAHEACPGAEQGAESTKSAYWLLMEAYFRDVTQEDLHVLLPTYNDPLQDPAYLVPPIGSHFSADDLILSPRATRGLKAVGAYPNKRIPVPSLLGGATPAGVQALEDVDMVAKLQGTAEAAAGHMGQGSIELDSSQQWIRQQANVMASVAHMPTPHASTASQLGFLPDFMTQIAAEQAADPGIAAAAQIPTALAEPSATDAAAVTHEGAGNQQPGEVDERSNNTTQMSLDRPGVQADKQQPEAADTAKPHTPTTWLEWERQLQSEEHSDIGPEMADEFMHPHTQWVLKQPVAKYVLDPHPVYFKHGRPTASSGAAAASGSPSGQSGDVSGQGTNTEADTATQREASPDTFTPRIPPSAFGATVHQAKSQPNFTSVKSHRHDAEPSQAADPSRMDQGGGESAMPALSGFSASQPMETPAGSEPYTPAGSAALQLLDRQNSNAGGGGSKSSSRPLGRQRNSINYSLLAGNRKPDAKVPGSLHKAGKKSSHKSSPVPQSEVRKDQAALAVAAAIAEGKLCFHLENASYDPYHQHGLSGFAGPPEQSIEEEWQKLQEHPDILAAAPDDEVLAEMLAVQAELLQQEIINRHRMSVAIQRLVADLPLQAAAAEERMFMAEYVKGYQLKMRAIKRSKTRDKREQAHREALRAVQQTDTKEAPRSVAGRIPGAFAGESIAKFQQVPLMTGELKDVLAGRTEDEEAMCAVCSGGLSVAPNLIVFCERCDIAVHQRCYGVDDIPAGEWLCWPCKVFEEEQRKEGVPQAKIRPPRWEVQGGQLEGGSKAVQCALCPIRQGAFRRTADGLAWMHEVDALWQPELSVIPGNICDAYQGVPDISADRLGVACAVCGRSSDGAVIRCSSSHCSVAFHPMCARNAGQYLAVKEVGNKTVYKAFCAQHSQQARNRDRELGLAVEVAGMPPKDAKQQKDKAAFANREALQGLAARESQHRQLAAIRLELERLRLLLERVSKRERLKREIARATTELQQAQLADPIAALHYEHQLATQPAQAPQSEASPAPQSDPGPLQLGPQSVPHALHRDSAEGQGHETEDTDAPGSSAAHSKPASQGWGRLKKMKLAAQADGLQDVGSKRKRDQDPDGQEEVASQSHKKKRSGGARARSQVKVDKERLMTSTEAAATNEKLPKGFMYVPAHRLNSGAISGNE
ncbi:MAG: hypothetical protein FRX49_04618 [Trebouxia sp. A1-2]|nr:MAG: hypothetical protein FRX49_04618 [Trebouxia sp. A1-2]